MSYNAWSVVAFEQPTAAKWNQLGTNDAGFKDGSNIDDSAILLRHINWQDNLLAEGHVIGGYLEATVSANDLIITMKTESGNNPTTSEPVKIPIYRTLRTIDTTLSLTLADGTNWGDAGSADLGTLMTQWFVYAVWNTTPATDRVDIIISRFPGAQTFADFSTTNTNPKYGAFSGANQPASTDRVVIIGRFGATLSKSGTSHLWTISGDGGMVMQPTRETDWLSITPTLAVSAGTAPTYTATFNTFYKLDYRTAFVQFNWNNTAGGTAGAGANPLTAQLPFPITTTVNDVFGLGSESETAGTIGFVMIQQVTNTSTIRFITSSGNIIVGDDQSSTARNIRGQFSYYIA